jgi:hypothetical protein
MKKRNLIISAVIAGLLAVSLAGCGTVNAWNATALTTGMSDYAGAKKNTQELDDIKLRTWLDSSCAVNIGALQRISSTSGSPNAVNAVFMACPVPNVGVTTILPSGNMSVQTTAIQPAAAIPAVPAK